MLSDTAVPPSVLAFLTTVHLGLVALRAHRSGTAGTNGLVVFVSFLLAVSPWLLPSVAGLAVGFIVHAAWFTACERLLSGGVVVASAGAVVRPPEPVRSSQSVSVARMARTPHPPAAPRPSPFVQAPVITVFDETPDIRTFRMARPDGFEFEAGQFLAVRLRADGQEHVRCYSISSPPSARGHLEITVKRIGLVSGALHATVRPGSLLAIRPPAGAFTYPAGDDRPLVLIAGGVGITPLMSMLRHAIDTEPTRLITLYYAARTVDQIAFRDELALLQRRHGQFRVFFAVSDDDVPEGYFPGFIDDSLLRTTSPDIAHAICLLCGPPPMLQAMKTLLATFGVPDARIRHEIFQAAIAANGGAAAAEVPASVPAVETVEVAFERSGVTTTIAPTVSLLDAAEACGATIPSLCRAGVCGTCRTRVLRGDVRCTSTMLDARDRAEGYVLPCVSHAYGDCVVDA